MAVVVAQLPGEQAFPERRRGEFGWALMSSMFLALNQTGQSALAKDLDATIASLNTASDGSMRVPSAFAQIVILKA